jgi:hypothetical protein
VEQKVKETEIDYRKGTIDGKYAKYDRGDKINTLDELLKQDVFIWGNVTRNQAWLRCQQFNWIMEHVLGYAYKCVLKKKHKYNSNNNITKEEYIKKLNSKIENATNEVLESILYLCRTSINSKFRFLNCYVELMFPREENIRILNHAKDILSKDYPFLNFHFHQIDSYLCGCKVIRYCIEWELKVHDYIWEEFLMGN